MQGIYVTQNFFGYATVRMYAQERAQTRNKRTTLKRYRVRGERQSAPNVEALRLVRNATFHFQNQLVSRKVFPCLAMEDSWGVDSYAQRGVR